MPGQSGRRPEKRRRGGIKRPPRKPPVESTIGKQPSKEEFKRDLQFSVAVLVRDDTELGPIGEFRVAVREVLGVIRQNPVEDGRVSEGGTDSAQVGVIKGIKRSEPELQTLALGKLERLEERHFPVA